MKEGKGVSFVSETVEVSQGLKIMERLFGPCSCWDCLIDLSFKEPQLRCRNRYCPSLSPPPAQCCTWLSSPLLHLAPKALDTPRKSQMKKAANLTEARPHQRPGDAAHRPFVSGQVPSSSESPSTDPEQKAPGSCPWPRQPQVEAAYRVGGQFPPGGHQEYRASSAPPPWLGVVWGA